MLQPPHQACKHRTLQYHGMMWYVRYMLYVVVIGTKEIAPIMTSP